MDVASVMKLFRTNVLDSSDTYVAERHATVIGALATSGPELDKVAPPPSKTKMTPEQFESAKAWRNTVIAHTERIALKPIRVEPTLKAMLAVASKRHAMVDALYTDFVQSLIDLIGKCHHVTMDGDMVNGDSFLTVYNEDMSVRYVCRITQQIMPDGLPQWPVRMSLTRE